MGDYALNSERLKALARLIKDAGHLHLLCEQGDYNGFHKHAQSMLLELHDLIDMLQNDSIESITHSLQRIMVLASKRPSKILDKIDFELLPLMQVLYNVQYFFRCVYPDKSLMERYYQQEMHTLGSNKYINNAVQSGNYKYDLSIAVIAFNKLDYTKQCVESILKNIPQGLSYELILINHGSTDGTKEYFESMSPTKQLDISVNGGGLAAYTFICEGKYFMLVSNDVIVTENAIANMIRCMESDEKIAWVVPATSSVSNLQTIPASYNTIDEMHVFAGKNNQRSDPCRWEQRTRLVDPISLRRSSVSFSSSGVNWAYYLYSQAPGGFSDDKEALLYRRNGYKMMLAKDSYCHHFGSVTLKDELAEQAGFYDEGRKAFCEAFGVDPWGTGFCWSPEMISLLSLVDTGHVNILGLNCGLGGNPLKIKETIKERASNFDVTIYNATDEKRYAQDLKGVSDIFAYEQDSSRFHELFSGVQFHYIVIESRLEAYQKPLGILKRLEKRLAAGGVLILRTIDAVLGKAVCKDYPTAIKADTWYIIPAGKNQDHHESAEDLLKEDVKGYRFDMTTEHRVKKLLERGEERFSQGDLSAAMKFFERATGLDKTNSQALNNLGVVQWQLGETLTAIEIFQDALTFNPEDTDALANLLQAAAETGRHDLLKPDLLDTVNRAQPANPDIVSLIDLLKGNV